MDIEPSMPEYQKLVLDEASLDGRRGRGSYADVAYGIGREKL